MGKSKPMTAPTGKSKPMTVQEIVEQLNAEERAWATDKAEVPQLHLPASDSSSSTPWRRRLIVVVNQLPVRATSDPDNPGQCKFIPEEDCPLLHLGDGVPAGTELVFVGTLPGAAVLPQELRDSLALGRHLLGFLFLPVFLQPNTDDRFSRLCKFYLSIALHSVIPYGVNAPLYDRSLSAAWDDAMAIFANIVDDAVRTHDDLVWVHDYHLFLLPSVLRRRHPGLRLGFSLHGPFPSRDIFLALPPARQILNSLLCCDLVGFHTLDHARHFLECCRRALGLHHRPRDSPSSHGFLRIDHLGRTIGIHVLPKGIHMASTSAAVDALLFPDGTDKLADLRREFNGKTVLLSIDELDVFKSIDLKLLAFELLLRKLGGCCLQRRIVLIQMVVCGEPPNARHNPSLRQAIQDACDRINSTFGSDHFQPVVVVELDVISLRAKAAFYVIADCLVDMAIRGGMNLIPYEYVVARQAHRTAPKKSRLVLSEFTGCCQALSRATRVNPMDPDKTAEALLEVIQMSEVEEQAQHEKHYKFIKTYDVDYWSRSFIEDLRSCRVTNLEDTVSTGIVVHEEDSFTELQHQMVTSAYRNATTRAILLDYDGTLESESSNEKAPKGGVPIEALTALCADPKNVVFIVSRRTKKDLEMRFNNSRGLGIAAERGYFARWGGQNAWKTTEEETINLDWVRVARPLLKRCTEAIKHSKMEIKDSGIVWRYEDAETKYADTSMDYERLDPSCALAQAREMVDHMKELLIHEPVVVKSRHHMVEVHPQGVNKGSAAKKILSAMAGKQRRADFVLCMGDDSSDEEMFEYFASDKHKDVVAPHTTVITCKAAKKPSKARYYLDSMDEVKSLLLRLSELTKSLLRFKMPTI